MGSIQHFTWCDDVLSRSGMAKPPSTGSQETLPLDYEDEERFYNEYFLGEQVLEMDRAYYQELAAKQVQDSSQEPENAPLAIRELQPGDISYFDEDNQFHPAPLQERTFSKNSKERRRPCPKISRSNSTGLYFENYEQVQAYDQSIIIFTPDPEDRTIPTNASEEQAWVRKLVAALKNTTDVNENINTKSFANRWGENAEFYADWEFESVAWRLVHETVDLHLYGCNVPVYDNQVIRDFLHEKDHTFKGRMCAIIELLTRAKRTCESLLKDEKFALVIGCPRMMTNRTFSNVAANKAKNEAIVHGRKIMRAKAGSPKDSGVGGDDDDDDAPMIPQTRGRKPKRHAKVNKSRGAAQQESSGRKRGRPNNTDDEYEDEEDERLYRYTKRARINE